MSSQRGLNRSSYSFKIDLNATTSSGGLNKTQDEKEQEEDDRQFMKEDFT